MIGLESGAIEGDKAVDEAVKVVLVAGSFVASNLTAFLYFHRELLVGHVPTECAMRVGRAIE